MYEGCLAHSSGITDVQGNKATRPRRMPTIPEKSCAASTITSVAEVEGEVAEEMLYDVLSMSPASTSTIKQSVSLESLWCVSEDESENHGLPVIVAVHGAVELKTQLEEIIDKEDPDAFVPQDELANIGDQQCTQPFRQPKAVPEQELLQPPPPPSKPPKIPAHKRSRSLSQEVVRGKGSSTLRTGSDHTARMVCDGNVGEADDVPCSGHLARRRLRLRTERQRHDYTHHLLRPYR